MITQKEVKQEKARVIKTSAWQYIKQWYKLANPSKGWSAVSVIFYLTYVSFYLVCAIFAAKTIDALYASDWTAAYLWLFAEFATILIRNIALEIQYRAYSNTYTSMFCNIQKKIYFKMITCQKSNFYNVSKQQISQTIVSNVGHICEFHDYMIQSLGNAIMAIVPLITIFVLNYWAGFIVIGLGILDFFVLKFANKKMGSYNKLTYDNKDVMVNQISKVVDASNVITEFNESKTFENEYMESVKTYCKNRKKYYNWYSFRTNGFYIIWNAIIYAISFLLIYMVTKGFDIAMYLLVISYLKTCSTAMIDTFNVGQRFEDMKIGVDRVNTILNFTDQELKKFGKDKYKIQSSTLNFVNVSYNNEDAHSEYFGKIDKLDISFKEKEINVVYGNRDCGKRVIFNLLRRRIMPDSGVILLDNIDLLRYDDSIYKENIFYVAGKPLFLQDTIMKNMLVANKDQKQIEEVCKKVEIYDWIMAQPDGFNTVIDEFTNPNAAFLLGLARALLTGCKILMIYELPVGISTKERNKILQILNNLKQDRTILIFTHDNSLNSIAGVSYQIENGKVASYDKNF